MNLTATLFGRTFSLGAEKAVSSSLAAWLRGDDAGDTGGAQLTQPYAQSAWVYIAVNRIAQKIAGIPFRISQVDAAPERSRGGARLPTSRGGASRGGARLPTSRRRDLDENIIESGEVVDLFANPHPHMARELFWETIVTWLCLRGESFIVPLDANDGPLDLRAGQPRVIRMLPLAPEMFWHVVQGYILAGWRYTGSPQTSPIQSEMLLPGEVIHTRTPNPYDFWRGLSPLTLAAVAAGADYAAAKYSQGYWLNNADTGVIVTTDQQATPEQRAAILSALRERKRKAGTADRPLFLWGGAKMEKPQLTGMESQFIENRKMNRQEIGAIFGVSDAVMGFNDAKSSALSGGGNAIGAEMLAFIENTIAPLCARLESALAPIVKSFGPNLRGWFDLPSLPIMQEARRTRLDTALKAFAIGVPLNDANQVYDLGFPEYDWGDKSFLPFNLQEVGTPEPAPSETPLPAADAEKSNPIARLTNLFSQLRAAPAGLRQPDTTVLWHSHVASRRKTVKLMTSKVTALLHQFRTSTLAKLEEIYGDRSAGGASVPASRSMADLIFNPLEFGNKLVAVLTNPITQTLQLAGNELHHELGLDDPWEMPPQKAKDYLAARTMPIMGTGQTVRDQINTALQAGLDNGETMKELTDRVKGAFNDLTAGEAKRIAQTETNMAYNDARHDAMKDAGIEYKAWLSSHGPHVREAHAEAEQRYIDNPIPVNEPFEVGGERLMYPGDDSLGASAGNIINCQCIQLAAEKTNEDATSTGYKIYGLGEVQFPKP